MLEIPRFYKKATRPSDETSRLSYLRKAEARYRFLEAKREEVSVSDEDWRTFWVQLYAYSDASNDGSSSESLRGRTLSRESFMSLGRTDMLNPALRQRIFNDETFLLFPRTLKGNIYASSFFKFTKELVDHMRVRYDFCLLDETNSGHLTEMQLAVYLDQFVPEMEDSLRKVYLSVLVRKFMFFLEQNHRVSMRNIMQSPILVEFLKRDVLERSWFNHYNVLGVIQLFKSLVGDDRRQSLMLRREEMLRFSPDFPSDFPRITSVVVDRLYAVKASPTVNNPNGELDFREFLNFVLAFESKHNEVSVRYFWDILDSTKKGYLDAFDVHELVSCVLDTIGRDVLYNTAGAIQVGDVVSEVFDMATGGRSTEVTLDDLNRSGQGATVLNMLTDPFAFLDYEQREARLSNQSQQQIQQGEMTDQTAYALEQQEAIHQLFVNDNGSASREISIEESDDTVVEEKAEYYSHV